MEDMLNVSAGIGYIGIVKQILIFRYKFPTGTASQIPGKKK